MNKLTNLVRAAIDVMKNSYSPYSNFRVGASILSSQGKIYSGCNIESSSYGATLCAEGSAIGSMVSHGDRLISEIVVTSSSDTQCYPCGICLQKILEFADEKTRVHICVGDKIVESYSVSELLPKGFKL